MAAQFQFVPFLCHDSAAGIVRAGKVLHHGEGFGSRHHLRFRIGFHEGRDSGGMVRLHVLDDQVIRLFPFQCSFQVAHPLLHEVPVRRIHYGHFLIQDHIGIVSHAFRHDIHSLEQIDLMIVYADIADILCHIHFVFSSRNYTFLYFTTSLRTEQSLSLTDSGLKTVPCIPNCLKNDEL